MDLDERTFSKGLLAYGKEDVWFQRSLPERPQREENSRTGKTESKSPQLSDRFSPDAPGTRQRPGRGYPNGFQRRLFCRESFEMDSGEENAKTQLALLRDEGEGCAQPGLLSERPATPPTPETPSTPSELLFCSTPEAGKTPLSWFRARSPDTDYSGYAGLEPADLQKLYCSPEHVRDLDEEASLNAFGGSGVTTHKPQPFSRTESERTFQTFSSQNACEQLSQKRLRASPCEAPRSAADARKTFTVFASSTICKTTDKERASLVAPTRPSDGFGQQRGPTGTQKTAPGFAQYHDVFKGRTRPERIGFPHCCRTKVGCSKTSAWSVPKTNDLTRTQRSHPAIKRLKNRALKKYGSLFRRTAVLEVLEMQQETGRTTQRKEWRHKLSAGETERSGTHW